MVFDHKAGEPTFSHRCAKRLVRRIDGTDAVNFRCLFGKAEPFDGCDEQLFMHCADLLLRGQSLEEVLVAPY